MYTLSVFPGRFALRTWRGKKRTLSSSLASVGRWTQVSKNRHKEGYYTNGPFDRDGDRDTDTG